MPQQPTPRGPGALARALAWGLGGSLSRVILQLGGQIALARVLGPEVYGVFIACALVLGLMVYVADAGLAYALVHRSEVNEIDLQFVLSWQAVIGVLAMALVAAAAPLAAGLLGDARLAAPLMALSPVLLFTALAAPSSNMLKRRMAFKALQIAQLLGYVLGYLVIGLPLALAGFGVWSLVAAWLVQSLLLMLLVLRAHPIYPRLMLGHADARGFGRFAGVVTATNIANWWAANFDKLLVARLFSASAVGLYGTAANLVNTPIAALNAALQSVVFSATARLRGDADATRRGFLVSLGLVLLVSLPIGAVLNVVAPALMLVLYGSAWRAAGPLLAWFALGIPLSLLWAVTTPVLWNADRISRELRLQLGVLLLLVPVLWLAGQLSVLAVVQVQIGITLLRTLLGVGLVSRRLHLGMSDLKAAAGVPLLLGMLWWAGAAACDALATAAGLPAWARVLAGGAGGVLAGLPGLRLLAPRLQADQRQALHGVSARLPAGLQRLVRALIP